MRTPHDTDAIRPTPGSSYLDREGRRWWVKGQRPSSTDQLVIEAHLPGSYPRVNLYVMTEREFAAHARDAGLTPERPGGQRRSER